MQKTILFLMAHFIVLTSLFAIQIERITDIYNGVKVIDDFGYYMGAITGFDDIVIVNNVYSIEEYEVQEDGSLHRIAHFDALLSVIPQLHIYQGRLYVLNTFIGSQEHYFRVFDLTQRPMVEIIEFEVTEVRTNFILSVGFQGSAMYLRSYDIYGHLQTVKYDIDTFTFLGYVTPAIPGDMFQIIGATLLSIQRAGNNSLLRCYEFENDQLTLKSSLALPTTNSQINPFGTSICGTDYVLPYINGVLVVDCADVMNPTVIADITVQNDNNVYDTVVYTGEYIIITRGGNIFWIYGRDEMGEFTLIGTKGNIDMPNASFGGLFANNNYFYHLSRTELRVFDLNTPDFDLTFQYGNYQIGSNPNILSQQNDFYYHSFNGETLSYDIYSIIDDELLVSLQDVDPNQGNIIYYFHIEDDILYAVIERNSQTHFEIYNIVDQQTIILGDTPLPAPYRSFLLINNKVFFSLGDTYVYSITDYQLNYLDSFAGRLGNTEISLQDDFLVTFRGSNVSIRASYDHNNVLLQASLPFLINDVSLIDGNYLLFQTGQTAYVYTYNLADNNVELLHTFTYPSTNTGLFNGIIASNANGITDGNERSPSRYYGVVNGEMVLIGEKEDRDKEVLGTYFYLERHKMVQVTRSSIWVYDFAYEEYVADSDIVLPFATSELQGNYPNPFNPSTTISFSLEVSGFVSLDVYNIKGQKVRSLVSDVRGAGEHQVVWNGCDEQGRSVGSGVYFYRLDTGGYIGVKKMVMVR